MPGKARAKERGAQSRPLRNGGRVAAERAPGPLLHHRLRMALLSASLLSLTSRSSVRLKRRPTPHHRSPTSAIRPAGQDLGAPSAPGIDDTTAPIVAESQSFLDNVIAQCVRT